MTEMITIATALEKSLKSATKGWTEAKRHADREHRIRRQDLARLRQPAREIKLNAAAAAVMEQAYHKASANGRLPANARQIMYAARPLVLAMTGGRCWSHSSYFTQRLLPDYMRRHPAQTAGWDVVFDARGRLVEPHTGDRTDLGTLEVRTYLRAWKKDVTPELDATLHRACKTRGPAHRYRFALFIEKEGFYSLLESEEIANRFDLAIMSTKGMSVTAARSLVDALSQHGVTILVLHDFDKTGFEIVSSLRTSGRRYAFSTRPRVVDLGLRLADVEALGLESEPVDYRSGVDPRHNLRRTGATPAECDFLVHGAARRWEGNRVELNAMPSDVFIKWLEAKLAEVGVTKVVPGADDLIRAYRRAARLAAVQDLIDELEATTDTEQDTPVPDDLAARVQTVIEGSAKSWDDAVWELAREERDGAKTGGAA